jgi:hypothetical protein
MDRVLTVQPISKKAKNRFANLMSSDGTCIIEQITGDKLFLRSANNKNFFWVKIRNDENWSITL